MTTSLVADRVLNNPAFQNDGYPKPTRTWVLRKDCQKLFDYLGGTTVPQRKLTNEELYKHNAIVLTFRNFDFSDSTCFLPRQPKCGNPLLIPQKPTVVRLDEVSIDYCARRGYENHNTCRITDCKDKLRAGKEKAIIKEIIGVKGELGWRQEYGGEWNDVIDKYSYLRTFDLIVPWKGSFVKIDFKASENERSRLVLTKRTLEKAGGRYEADLLINCCVLGNEVFYECGVLTTELRKRPLVPLSFDIAHTMDYSDAVKDFHALLDAAVEEEKKLRVTPAV